MPASPTGRQLEIRSGEHVAVVVELGGGLREYRVGDRPVLDGYPVDEQPEGGRGQVLAPWPNRVGDGRYRWEGVEYQLDRTEAKSGNAIHGLVRRVPWSVRDESPERVVLGVTVDPVAPGYPWSLDVRAEYAVGPDGLQVTLTGTNVGTGTAPYGVGQHPYLTAGTDRVDEVLLTVPADEWLRTDARGLPVATEPVEGTPYDFRVARPVGELVLDTAYAGLTPAGDGRTVVRLAHPADGTGVDLWLGDGAGYLQVFTGDTLPDPARRRRGLAVEPMSCPPDAFRSGTAVAALGPGATHRLQWGLRAW